MGHEIQQTRWDRILRRVTGSIGPGSRASELLSEVFPMVSVEDPPAELLVLGGTRMAVGFSSEPAVAAVFQVSELFNPVDSGAIITLLSVAVFSDDLFVGMGMTSGSFTNDNSVRVDFSEGRLFPDPPVGQVRDETAGAAGNANVLIGMDGVRTITYAPPKAVAVLSPGSGWSVGTQVVNTQLTVNYTWLERPAEESELSL